MKTCTKTTRAKRENKRTGETRMETEMTNYGVILMDEEGREYSLDMVEAESAKDAANKVLDALNRKEERGRYGPRPEVKAVDIELSGTMVFVYTE